MNLDYNIGCKENFNNVKVIIRLMPFSSEINSFKLSYSINKNYNLVDYGEYFVPYYYTGPEGAEVVIKETYIKNYHEHENRIKKEYLNKFIRTGGINQTCFYGYFETVSKANRVYNKILKPFILKKLLPYERINDSKLIDDVKNIRF